MAALGMPLAAPATAAGPAGSGVGTSEKARLSKAAVEFEAVLLGQWLESAERSFGTVPGSEEDEDAGGQQMHSFAMQSLAHALAARDTLGIAKTVQQGLEQAAGGSAAKTPELPSAAAEGAWRAKLPIAP